MDFFYGLAIITLCLGTSLMAFGDTTLHGKNAGFIPSIFMVILGTYVGYQLGDGELTDEELRGKVQ